MDRKLREELMKDLHFINSVLDKKPAMRHQEEFEPSSNIGDLVYDDRLPSGYGVYRDENFACVVHEE